ncbi:hypothetical protein BAE44_0003746 [Dichanthelium oligosanthes]|uniref:Uncharacterized protein n=1 Tax=Dichanthelium oligosanthes TaxID=888268 RepID=A0A1E5WCX2_9POAL|nr:hypothetical protein BAE44_0003746 [Dichanthelium oligosanthes]
MAAAKLAVVVAAVAVVVAAALPMLAAGAYADCFDYCFKDCIAKDRSMRDYCNYACDKTCAPDDALKRRPVAAAGGLAMACQVDCVRKSCHGVRADGEDMVACYGQCYDGCPIGPGLPRPLRAGKGVVRAAALPDHPFHEKQDGVGSAALPGSPYHEKQDADWSTALPGSPYQEKQDGVRPAALPDHPFHEKQDAVWPAALPDHPFHEKQDGVGHQAWGHVHP